MASTSNGPNHRNNSMGPPISASARGIGVNNTTNNTTTTNNNNDTMQNESASMSPTPSLQQNSTSSTEGLKASVGRALSCSECKRRKIKCDRGAPCTPCILRNDQARCKPVIRWEAGCSLSEFTMLQNKVNELEGRINDMQSTLGGSSSLPSVSISKAINTAPRSDSTIGSNTVQKATTTGGTGTGGGGEDDAVMMLEDFAMGNRAHTRRAAQKLNQDPTRMGDSSPESSYLETGASQRSADAAIDVAYRFLRLAPNPETSRVIVDYYFDRLEWYTKCLHRPSYMRDLHQLLSLDLETAARIVRPSFICLHFMVLCLAIHLASGEEVLRWGFDTYTAMQLCDALFAGSQQLLWASDFIGSHQLEHLQAYVLISVYAYNVDEQADAAFALMGAAIKIAQNLNLNRLDDAPFMEKESTKTRLTSGGRDSGQLTHLEREMSKRVWWYLIWLDWSHALSHGGSYSINPAHNKTNLPSNVDDEDLETKETTLQVKPLEEYTSMGFTIWRLRFLLIYREIIDLINQPGGITHAQVYDVDKKLMNLLNGLPNYFQLRTEDSRSWTFGDSCHDMELLSIQITGHNRILRLHRPYLAKGLQDRNNISRKRCVDAAFSILALFRHAKNHAPILLRVWINIYYVFSGALVLFLDLCYDNDVDAKAAEEKRMAVREMLEICSEARHLSAASKNTYNLLQGLLEAENEVRGRQEGNANRAPSSAKRKRAYTGGDAPAVNRLPTTPFVSLVERVLVDAATKHSGGESASSSSIGKSPGEPLGDGSSKLHHSSFIRNRTSSMDSRQARDSPQSMSIGSSGVGHGGFFQEANYNRSGNNAGYGYGPVKTGITSQPTSPWGPPNSAVRSKPWNPATPSGNNNNNNTTRFASPSGSAGGYGMLNSPGLPYGDMQGKASVTMGGASLNLTARTPETTNGLSSLLDEDIFSGLLMSQPMGTNDWASAFNFVAPPSSYRHQEQPNPQQQYHHHHMHYQEG